MDSSRGKRKSKTVQRAVQKPDDNSLQAPREKAPTKSQESKALGEWMHVTSSRLCKSVPSFYL
jgi:hypothetical protein